MLANNVLRVKTKKWTYSSGLEQTVLDNAGSAFSAVSYLTLAFALAMCLFQSAAVGAFWSFVNMLQILSYLPIIDCDLPSNFEIFITEYLTVSQVVFPFQMLPQFVPNPLSFLTDFLTAALNDRYSLCGYESVSFIYNFGSQLLTWILLFLLYLVLLILVRIIPKSKYGSWLHLLDVPWCIHGRVIMNIIP